jgi:hypothetical protein
MQYGWSYKDTLTKGSAPLEKKHLNSFEPVGKVVKRAGANDINPFFRQ